MKITHAMVINMSEQDPSHDQIIKSLERKLNAERDYHRHWRMVAKELAGGDLNKIREAEDKLYSNIKPALSGKENG
jgi:hypothetical protein